MQVVEDQPAEEGETGHQSPRCNGGLDGQHATPAGAHTGGQGDEVRHVADGVHDHDQGRERGGQGGDTHDLAG